MEGGSDNICGFPYIFGGISAHPCMVEGERDSDPFARPTIACHALAVPATQACSDRLFSCEGNVKKTSTRVLLLAMSCASTKISFRCFSNISNCLVEGTVGRSKIEFRYVRLQSIENYRYLREARLKGKPRRWMVNENPVLYTLTLSCDMLFVCVFCVNSSLQGASRHLWGEQKRIISEWKHR